jgi:hypothetical protein
MSAHTLAKSEHSLDALLAHPDCCSTLTRAAALDLLTRTTSLSAMLTARVLATAHERPDTRHHIELPDADDLITTDEAAKLLRRSRRWLYRHKRKLPFIHEISPRSLLCSKRGIANWLAAHTSAPG